LTFILRFELFLLKKKIAYHCFCLGCKYLIHAVPIPIIGAKDLTQIRVEIAHFHQAPRRPRVQVVDFAAGEHEIRSWQDISRRKEAEDCVASAERTSTKQLLPAAVRCKASLNFSFNLVLVIDKSTRAWMRALLVHDFNLRHEHLQF
jgi:hypothetical protein